MCLIPGMAFYIHVVRGLEALDPQFQVRYPIRGASGFASLRLLFLAAPPPGFPRPIRRSFLDDWTLLVPCCLSRKGPRYDPTRLLKDIAVRGR